MQNIEELRETFLALRGELLEGTKTTWQIEEKYKQKKRPFWNDSEFVVYDEAQVQQRYLVQFKKK